MLRKHTPTFSLAALCRLSFALVFAFSTQVWAEEPTEAAAADGYCWSQGLSPAAAEVMAALQPNGLSQLGSCNRFNTGIGLPQDDWLHTISSPTELNTYRAAIADLLVDTRSTFSHSRLWYDGTLMKQLSEGLCTLHNSLSTGDRARKPIIRFNFSNPLGNAAEYTEKAWSALVDRQVASGCLPANTSLWNFHLAVRTAHSFFFNNKWNHGKVTIRDDGWAISGSVETPLPELAVALSGDSAEHAQDFFEAIWGTNHRDESCWTTEESLCRPRDEWRVEVPAADPPPVLYGTNVFSLGRNFELWAGGDDSADHAIYAAFEAAQETLFISQAAFAADSAYGIVDELVDRIGTAAAGGAGVTIALGKEGFVEPQDQAADILDRASDRIGDLTSDWVDHDLSLCRIRIADHPNAPDDSHAKSFEVDRTLFYIGSQNLYPSGIGNDGPAELSEHGFLVDGYGSSKHLANRYHSDYAAPTWSAATADAMWIAQGCDQVLYPTHLLGTASNGYSCDITFDTEFNFISMDMDFLAGFYGEGVCNTGGYTIDITISGEIVVTGDPSTYGEIQNGVISGSVRGTGVSDSTALEGTFSVDAGFANQLDAAFDGLELGVTYSGTVSRN